MISRDTEIGKAYLDLKDECNKTKANLLLALCESYKLHLEAEFDNYANQVGLITNDEDMQKSIHILTEYGDRAGKILVEKYEQINILIDILLRDKLSSNPFRQREKENGQEKILIFTRQFYSKSKSIFEKNRNNPGMIFIKAILSVLSLGIAPAFGLWRTAGDNFNKKITEALEYDTSDYLRSRFSKK